MTYKPHVFLMSILMLSLACPSSKAQTPYPTQYPLKPDPANTIEKINIQRKNHIVHNLKRLKLGEVSKDVVKTLGYAPDAYGAAPNKSLDQPPSHYVMIYFIQRHTIQSSLGHAENLKNQQISFIFDKDEKLTSILYSGVSKVKRAVNPKIPVVDMNEK